MSVCARIQLEMHSPENTNKITEVREFTCTKFDCILLYMMEDYAYIMYYILLYTSLYDG